MPKHPDADGRTPQPRGRERRQQILDAAVELFATKGFRGTGVGSLAAHVGMTTPGLMYYFGTRERLLADLVAERDRIDLQGLPAEVRLADLAGLGRHNVETALLTRLYTVLTAESFERDAPLHEFFVNRYQTTREFFRDLLEREQERGDVRADVDVEQIAKEIASVALGAETQWLLDPDGFDLASFFENYIERLVVDLGPYTDV